MKKYNAVQIALAIAFAIVFVISFTSCKTVKDCRGVKHTKLANGVRL